MAGGISLRTAFDFVSFVRHFVRQKKKRADLHFVFEKNWDNVGPQ